MDSEISGSILLSVFFLRLFRSSLFETVISIFNVCCHYQICCTAVYCCNFDFLRVEHVWYHFIVTFIAISLSHMQESFSHFLTKQRCCAILYHSTCEYSLTVKLQLPKLALRVRFPLFAPIKAALHNLQCGFFLLSKQKYIMMFCGFLLTKSDIHGTMSSNISNTYLFKKEGLLL